MVLCLTIDAYKLVTSVILIHVGIGDMGKTFRCEMICHSLALAIPHDSRPSIRNLRAEILSDKKDDVDCLKDKEAVDVNGHDSSSQHNIQYFVKVVNKETPEMTFDDLDIDE